MMENFEELRKVIENYYALKDKLIKISRDILSLSKKVIYALHRGNLREAEVLLGKMEKKVSEFKEVAEKEPKLLYSDFCNNVLQEYVEAKSYYTFIKLRKLPEFKDVPWESFIAGICDLSGELLRRSVNAVINNKIDEIFEIREFLNNIYSLLIQLDIREGYLRKKVDMFRWNLDKVENIMLEIKLRE